MLTRRRLAQLAAYAPFALAQALRSRDARADIGRLGGGTHEITLLYTNDFHSAFDPTPAFWRPGSPRLGGAAHLATLIDLERAQAGTSFLLDSGDMFTGTLSLLTEGEVLMEMMSLFGYDAMGVGNHEFDYGWRPFDRARDRVPFPILCANIRHRGSGVRYTRPYTVIERDGVRVGILGVMGLGAARFTIMPSKVAELEFTDPIEEAAACLAELRPTVDMVVVLAHQGLPGPMQSDAENDPSVQRPLDEDLAFCAALPGVDVYVAAHSHHGLEQPLVHPATGALLVQTYGYGTRLGRLRLTLRDRKVVGHEGRLLEVASESLPADPAVEKRIAHYRGLVAERIGPPLGRLARRLIRRYNSESPLGAFATDAMREKAGSEVALTNAGGLRADMPEGPVDRGHVLDAFPFLNDSVTLLLAGRELRAVLEQGLSLRAGMVQASGVHVRFDLTRPIGARLVDVRIGDQPCQDERLYRVTTNSFLAEGGDGYLAFRQGREVARDGLLSDVLVEHIRRAGTIAAPAMGRLVPA